MEMEFESLKYCLSKQDREGGRERGERGEREGVKGRSGEAEVREEGRGRGKYGACIEKGGDD